MDCNQTNPANTLRIGCVIKAAGKSQRFGSNKLLADLNGKPLLAYIAETLSEQSFSRLVCVTSSKEVDRLCQQLGLETLFYDGGPVSDTVRLGLSVMQDMDGCLFAAGDQPLVSAASIQRLLDAFQSNPDTVCRLSFDGIPGAPVIFPKRLFSKLSELSGERGGMAAAAQENIITIPAERAEELLDADTPEALELIRNCF